ncbi:MAG: hypothetical protein JSW73_05180 [Candidatus Woesearchaeota archaeon]|nr:MAG: hypothetical protein JSW73_05180 [Candidatus Woesearchaeota archaeon]
MGLFRKKKKDDMEGVSVKPSSEDFDIDDIDLPPLPDTDEELSKDLEFSKKMPQNEDLPPLPEPPTPYYDKPLPKKQPPEFPFPKIKGKSEPPKTPEFPVIPPLKPITHVTREEPKAPIFIRVDKYKEVLDVIDSLKKDLKLLVKSLESLKNSKDKEDEIIAGWNGLLSEVASKLDKIDTGLFEPEE